MVRNNSASKRWIAGIVLAGAVSIGAPGVAQALSPLELNGSVTDASSDIEVAEYADRDLTMNRLSHDQAIEYAAGYKTAVQATKSLNAHLGRYCAASRLISRALSDQGYNSATIQNFYYQSGCMGAPAMTHQGPKS
jgi:hypothetical protein